MLSIFKKESNRHWDLFFLNKEIIEHSYSLSSPRQGSPIVILHRLGLTEGTFKSDVSKKQSNIRMVIQSCDTLLPLSL